MSQSLYHVDAFTSRPFAGNPAAVCVMSEPREEAWMQDVAAEMNLSETAFLHPENDGFRLRWFTPTTEVELCGHATLASAHVLWEAGHLERDREAVFHTRSGELTATTRGDWIAMDFPAEPAREAELPERLIAALGSEPVFAGRNRFDHLIELESADAVRELTPDLALLRKTEIRGMIVTAQSEAEGHDFVSRFFAPGVGVDEDPVTGSAHCCLGPYWGERLGKTELIGYQASARGGVVRMTCSGDRVLLSGQAVTVMVGELVE